MRQEHRVPAFAGTLFSIVAGLSITAGPLLSAEPTKPPGAVSAEPGCSRLEAGIPGTWNLGGAWLAEDRLLLPDLLQGSVRRVVPSEGTFEDLVRPGRGLLEFTKPIAATALLEGAAIRDADGRILWLNRYLEPYGGIRLPEAGRPEILDVTVREAELSSDGRFLVGYGDLETSLGSWTETFFAADLEAPALRRLELGPLGQVGRQARSYFLDIYPYATRLGDRWYFAVLDAQPRLLEITRKPGKATLPASSGRYALESKGLAAFPERFLPVPSIDSGLPLGLATIHQVYAELESRRLPAGLYAGRDLLYWLMREPNGRGGTIWSLFGLDPVADQIVSERILPTSAPYVGLVPGERSWAVVEKGSVQRGGGQELLAILLLPTPWIESKLSPLDVEGIGAAKIECAARSLRRGAVGK